PPPSSLLPYTTLFRSGLGDVAADHDVPGQLQLLGQLVDDAHVRLMRHEHVDVLDAQTGLLEHLADLLGGVPHGPAEHGAAVLLEDRKSTRLNSSHVSI